MKGDFKEKALCGFLLLLTSEAFPSATNHTKNFTQLTETIA
jgi:hypothetical protein